VGVVNIFKDPLPLSLSRKKCMLFNPEIVINFITFLCLTDRCSGISFTDLRCSGVSEQL
jgi:hypothetical protein